MTTFNSKKLEAAGKVRDALKAYRAIGGKFIEAQVKAMEAIFNVDECSADPDLGEARGCLLDLIEANYACGNFMAHHAMRSIEGTWAGDGFRGDAYGHAMDDLINDYFPTLDSISDEWRDYAAGQRENAYVDARSGK